MVCNGDPATVVLAHYRLADECGTGYKPDDVMGAFACSSCHDAVDFRTDSRDFTRTEIRHMHAEGCLRTFAQLRREGIL